MPRTRWLLYGLRSRPGTVFVGGAYYRTTDRAEDAPGSKLAVLAQAKVRGRNRITGNRSARSRPLAPSQPPPRIAIANDVPPRGRKMLVILVRDQACRQSNAGRSLHQLPYCDPGRSVQDCGSAERGEKVLSSIRLCRRIRSISSSPTRRFGRAQLERARSGCRAPSLDPSKLGGRGARVPARRNLFPRMSMAHRGSVL